MAEPSRKHDICRHCGEDIEWLERQDPDEVPDPGERPDWSVGEELLAEWRQKYELRRTWMRNKPRWAGVRQWWHAVGEDYHELCDPMEAGNYSAKRAEATNFCIETIQKGDSWRPRREKCNRPVTYEEWGCCGVHAKPHIEERARKLRYEQKQQEQQMIEDTMMVLVHHLREMGLKAELEGYTGRRSGKIIVPPETITALLKMSDEYEEVSSVTDGIEVAEGFNPFVDAEVEEDEEEDEWVEL